MEYIAVNHAKMPNYHKTFLSNKQCQIEISKCNDILWTKIDNFIKNYYDAEKVCLSYQTQLECLEKVRDDCIINNFDTVRNYIKDYCSTGKKKNKILIIN